MRSTGTSSATGSRRPSPWGSEPRGIAVLLLAASGAGLAGFAGCTSVPAGPPDAAAGRSYFVSRCTQCHELPEPGEYSAVEWRALVRQMGPRSGLNPAQQRDILEFVLTEQP